MTDSTPSESSAGAEPAPDTPPARTSAQTAGDDTPPDAFVPRLRSPVLWTKRTLFGVLFGAGVALGVAGVYVTRGNLGAGTGWIWAAVWMYITVILLARERFWLVD